MSEVVEIPAADLDIPEGHLGNLTEEYHNALVNLWDSYFGICDRAHGKTTSTGGQFQAEQTGSDLKNSGIPNDDKAKEEMKKQQEQQGMNELMDQYGPEAVRDAWWKTVRGDNPDGTMLRFVRARKGDVDRALAMMATCLKWRMDSDVESLIASGDLENGKSIPKFTEQQKSGKVFALGCTTKEQPICYVIMKHHSIWGQPAASMQKFIVTQMETFRLLIHPPQDKATIFFDLKGFGLKQMDVVNLLYLVKVLESYYPEYVPICPISAKNCILTSWNHRTLGTMYISNAPWIFWGFWKAVKNLLDPVVRNKIKFISSPKDTEGDVPEDNLIKHCGGTITSSFDYVDPIEGENRLQQDEAKKEKLLARHKALTEHFEQVTREWCKTSGKDTALTEQREIIARKLRLSHFDLEPYTRGLTVYHRNGVLPKGNPGISVFDYEVPGKTTQRQILGRKTCQKTTELELYDIIKNGSLVKDAEEKIAQALRDGTWGEWRNNDNTEEIKKVAHESLTDLKSNERETVPAPATDVSVSEKVAEEASKPTAVLQQAA